MGMGILHMLNDELLQEDSAAYKNFLRLTNHQFEKLLRLVEPHISRQDTVMRQCVSARSRLELTLRFLATGESYRSLMYSSRIHESTISLFIPEVCEVIFNVLKDEFLMTPSTPESWQSIADQFMELWQFPQCVGALDGRHITFRSPKSAGSFYHNYKGDHSLVLLAMADACCKFTYINIGVNGRISDGGVFRDCTLSKAIQNNSLNFPQSRPLPGSSNNVPYVIVADDAFPLSTRIVKPYPQRGLSHDKKIFNYRLSRARRIIEHAFGILPNRFRVLLNPICLSPNKVEKITLACVALHNYLCTNSGQFYTDFDEASIITLDTWKPQGTNRTSRSALSVRDEYKNYF
ncbi:uncharacterized protein LOC116165000 [Photinus pyralis]|uniref:uncharacterized protein LOC116165000 n=1 Tax=Photinus pyralis TaxID=7054 RepID=UPI00126705F6|nr:uncharacterized protein LOC116165000 [Photinus pyralis]